MLLSMVCDMLALYQLSACIDLSLSHLSDAIVLWTAVNTLSSLITQYYSIRYSVSTVEIMLYCTVVIRALV